MKNQILICIIQVNKIGNWCEEGFKKQKKARKEESDY